MAVGVVPSIFCLHTWIIVNGHNTEDSNDLAVTLSVFEGLW